MNSEHFRQRNGIRETSLLFSKCSNAIAWADANYISFLRFCCMHLLPPTSDEESNVCVCRQSRWLQMLVGFVRQHQILWKMHAKALFEWMGSSSHSWCDRLSLLVQCKNTTEEQNELFVSFHLNNICSNWFIHGSSFVRQLRNRKKKRKTENCANTRSYLNALELCENGKTSI